MAGSWSRTSALLLVVEAFENGDRVVGIEVAHALGDGRGLEILEDFLADRLVHLGQRREVEGGAQQLDQARAVLRLEGLEQVAQVGFVEILHQRAQALGVRGVDGVGGGAPGIPD